MKHKYVLLAGIFVPVLLLFSNATVAAPDSPMVVAQAQPQSDADKAKKKPPVAVKPATPPPGAAKPHPVTPPTAVKPVSPAPPTAARPHTQPPAAMRPVPQHPVVQQPTVQQPVQKQIKPVQTQPVIQPHALPPARQATPQIAPALVPNAGNVRKLDAFRGQRQETRQGNSVIIKEPGRTIVRDGSHLVIQRNESDRFRLHARNVQTERRGADLATIIERPNGVRIIDLTDSHGRLLRRSRRDARGHEVVLIDNARHGAIAGAVAVGAAAAVAGLVILNLRPPVVHIPRDRYIVEADRADRALIYETLMAPPVEVIDRGYSLDEIRYNVYLRDRMPRIDIDTITFDFGSWEVTPDQAQRLQFIADGIHRALRANPDEVFLIEGHTDAVGTDIDNLSLSDRRAELVAEVLTEQFGVPPENLTTQGYGKQYLKIPTPAPERRNRRVAVRRITPLLNGPLAQRR